MTLSAQNVESANKTMNVLTEVPSPCVRICRLQDGICVGCKRTAEEITLWTRFTDSQKLAVLERIKLP